MNNASAQIIYIRLYVSEECFAMKILAEFIIDE